MIIFKKLFILFLFLVLPKPGTVMEFVSLSSLMKDKKLHIEKKLVNPKIKLRFKRFPLASSKNSTYENPILPETFVTIIPNGQVYSDQGIIIYNKKILKDFIWDWSPLKRSKKNLTCKTLPKIKHFQGRIAILAQEGAQNYYHWVVEVLPKLALLQKARVEYDWLYIPKTQKPFILETLKLLGININQIIFANSLTHILADQLIVPSFVSKSCYTPHWVSNYLKDKLVRKTIGEKNQHSFSEKIFISRKKALYRRILNEEEVENYLKSFNFQTVYLEELTVKEQIALFHQAKIIVGFHGAGLTNLLWSKPKTRIIEIFQEHEDDTFCYLAQTLGLDYHAILTTPFKKNSGYKNTYVDVKKLAKKLEILW